MLPVPVLIMFFSSMLWCSWSDNHPPEDLAKFGYILDIKIKTFKPPLFHTSIKVNAPLKSKRWSDFQIVCGDWTYSVEEKPLNWKKCKIAYCNCIWVFFCVIQCFFFFYFSIFWTGDEVVIIHKMIKPISQWTQKNENK